jgi:hypothetical protein
MADEAEFVAALARALGPLYRVSVTTPSGDLVAASGQIAQGSASRAEIPLPGSPNTLLLEIDVQALERADRVLHSLTAAYLTQERLPIMSNLDDALDHLIAQGEAYVGKSVSEMSRKDKQQLVRFLDERGAFALRKAVERVADTMNVSRFTVYNYLDANRT